MRKPLLCFTLLLCAAFCKAQKSYGVTQDYYVYRNGTNRLVPAVYGQTDKGWYGQVRYNYEEAQTLSLLAGKTFAKSGNVAWSVTPQAGFLAGRLTGLNASFQAKAKAGAFSFSVEPQYCVPFSGGRPSFFYNWSEFSMQPLRFLYAGFALQQTAANGERMVAEPGLVLGLNAGRLELPVYYFKQWDGEGYLVLGLHWKLEK